VERIFRFMVTSDDQKLRLATNMLAKEDEFWWTNAKRRLEIGGEVVSWERFKEEFLRKYFPKYLRNKKEVEFLHLKQGNMSVADYVANFEELSKFCPYINVEDAMVSKCVKFESGLQPERFISKHAFMRSMILTLWLIRVGCLMKLGSLRLTTTRL